MNTQIVGTCKKEISLEMPAFTDRDDFVQEYSIKLNQTTNIYKEFDENEDEKYYVLIHYKKHYMNRQEVEEHFTIDWEYGCYNTCIRNEVPCMKLGYIEKGTTSLSKRKDIGCGIGWEIGRADCYKYQAQ